MKEKQYMKKLVQLIAWWGLAGLLAQNQQSEEDRTELQLLLGVLAQV